MGGSYVSGWKVGNAFGWKSNEGKMLTKGEIIAIEPGKLLKHSLFDSLASDHIKSVITYTFLPDGEKTLLKATEELHYPVSEKKLAAINEGWDAALGLVKEIAEHAFRYGS